MRTNKRRLDSAISRCGDARMGPALISKYHICGPVQQDRKTEPVKLAGDYSKNVTYRTFAFPLTVLPGQLDEGDPTLSLPKPSDEIASANHSTSRYDGVTMELQVIRFVKESHPPLPIELSISITLVNDQSWKL